MSDTQDLTEIEPGELDDFDEPIDQVLAEQVYRDSDVGIPIRNPVTREYYTLYGPMKYEVLKRRKRQGFMVVGTEPPLDDETLRSDDPSASGGIPDETSDDTDDENVAATEPVAGDGDGTADATDAPNVAPATLQQFNDEVKHARTVAIGKRTNKHEVT